MVYQLYYGNGNIKTLPNISILAVVSPSWPWDEKEFSSGFGECPTYKNCEVRRIFSHEMSGQPDADATIVTGSAFASAARHLSNLNGRNTILYFNLENPHYHPLHSNERYGQQFEINLTMTYKHDSDIVTPYGKWIYKNKNHR